jgi:hypothetical protein
VGASYGGTRARTAYELGEGMSESDMKRGRSPNGDPGPQRGEQEADLMEALHCIASSGISRPSAASSRTCRCSTGGL